MITDNHYSVLGFPTLFPGQIFSPPHHVEPETLETKNSDVKIEESAVSIGLGYL